MTFRCPFVFVSFQKKANFEPTSSYLLKNLKPFSTYTFQLAAKSKHGIGAYTNEVSIDTPQTRRSNYKYCCVWTSMREREREVSILTMQKWESTKKKPEPQIDWIPDLAIMNWFYKQYLIRNLAVVAFLHSQKGAVMNPDLNWPQIWYFDKQLIYDTQNLFHTCYLSICSAKQLWIIDSKVT